MKVGNSVRVITAALIMVISVNAFSSDKEVTLNISISNTLSILIDYFEEVAEEVYVRDGIRFNIIAAPSKRTLKNTNDGVYDGLAFRADGINRKFPNLIKIPTSVLTFQHLIYTHEDYDFSDVADFDDLYALVRKNNYTVGYDSASKKSREELAPLSENNIYHFPAQRQGFEMLKRKRIHAYLATPGIYVRYLFRQEYSHYPLKEVGVFSEFPVFTYLHRKHKNLIDRLDRVYSEMHADGTLQRIQHNLESRSVQ